MEALSTKFWIRPDAGARMSLINADHALALRVIKGGFVPANEQTRQALRRARLKEGNLVLANIERPRKPGFYRLAHAFARVCRENIDDFEGLTEHEVLKQLQLDTGLGCRQISVPAAYVWDQAAGAIADAIGDEAMETLNQVEGLLRGRMVSVRSPKSLNFGAMSEDEFRHIFQGFCRHIAFKYWPTLSDQQVAELAHFMPENEL
jgi:hypothetical protein